VRKQPQFAGAMESAAVSPDAALIQLCEEFDALQRLIYNCELRGSTEVHDEKLREKILAPVHERQKEILKALFVLRATTLAGFLARARMYRLYEREKFEEETGYHDVQMIIALVRDMTDGLVF